MDENKIHLDDKCRRDLCALVDGEANDFEVQGILTAMDGENAREVRELWRRYNLASNSIRNETFGLGFDVSGDVAAAIKNQPIRHLTGPNKILESILQLGVAALVAMLTIFSVQYFNNSNLVDQTTHNVKVELNGVDASAGPAAQFPNGFKPNINVQTVSVGSIRKSDPKVSLDTRLFQDDKIRDHIDRKVSEYYRQSTHIDRDRKNRM